MSTATSPDMPMEGMEELLRQRIPPTGIAYRRILPRGLRATKNTYRIYPTQPGPFAPNGIKEVFIPLTGTTGFLDSQHSFFFVRVKNNCTYARDDGVAHPAAAKFDQSAQSMINRLRFMAPDGTELERIEKYNRLVSVLSDIQYTMDARTTVGNALTGYGSNNVENLGSDEPLIAPNDYRSYEIPLMSGFLCADRYIPLGLIKGSGVRLELLLEDANLCMTQDPAFLIELGATGGYALPLANDYQITECYFVASIIAFEDDVIATILAEIGALRMPISMHSVSYDMNSSSAQANAAENVHQFSFRNRSAKAIMSFPENSTTTLDLLRQYLNERATENSWWAAATSNLQKFQLLVPSISMRPNFNIFQYQYRVGNVVMPVTPMIGGETSAISATTSFTASRWIQPQFISEIYKSFNRAGDLHSGGTITDKTFSNTYGLFNYGAAPANQAPLEANPSRFLMMQSLESFPNDASLLESGYDTATNALQLYLTTNSNVGTPLPTYQMIHYSMYDAIYSFSGAGNVYVSK